MSNKKVVTSKTGLLKKQVKELRKSFEIEKQCKNKAYDFIISYRLIELFRDFCCGYKGGAHKNCIKHLMSID